MTPDVPGKGPVDETMRARVHAIAQEAYRRRLEQTHPGHDIDAPTVILAIEIALSGWTPPEPVDPDVLAFREWFADLWNAYAEVLPGRSAKSIILEGASDNTEQAAAYLAGARMAREQERERAGPLVEYVRSDTRRNDQVGERAREVLAKYRGEA